ncbi:MAG TPA: 50S ribosomal protein L21 [Rhizobiaceae bacterium]|nr:50S ribosomal protein L21 [Rhizobiaceae bacterium]
MFAVIKTGGKQYRVAANDEIKVEKLAGEAGDIVEIGHVLMVGEGADVAMGSPFVEGAMVTAEVVEQGRSKKTLSFKKRRRQNSKRIKGHRQHLTTLRIAEILTGGAKPSAKAKKAAPKAEPKAALEETVSAAASVEAVAEAPVAKEKKAAKPKAAATEAPVEAAEKKPAKPKATKPKAPKGEAE